MEEQEAECGEGVGHGGMRRGVKGGHRHRELGGDSKSCPLELGPSGKAYRPGL